MSTGFEERKPEFNECRKRRHGAGRYDVERRTEIRFVRQVFCAGVTSRDVVEPKIGHDIVEERDLLAGRVDERNGKIRPGDRQDEPGESRPRAKVEQARPAAGRGDLAQRLEETQTLDDQAPLDAGAIANGGEIGRRGTFEQRIPEAAQLLQLIVAE